MKKSLIFFLYLVIILTLCGCRSIFRVYNDSDLSLMAKEDFGFSEVYVFKIVYPETALELTGKTYNNGGVIIGVREGVSFIVFVPKLLAKEPFLLNLTFTFDLPQIYEDLRTINANVDQPLDPGFFEDYGGLSITVEPYELISEAHADLDFNSRVFFLVTADDAIFSIGFIEDGHIIFDKNKVIIG